MGSYNTYDIHPRIQNFAQAKKHYESVVPIRGDKDKTRPLGRNRRYHRTASIEMPNPDTVNLMYGWGDSKNPLVQWRSDNTFTVTRPTYANAYDPDNLTFFLPQGKFSWIQGRLFIDVPGNKRYLMSAKEEFNFQMIDGQMFMANKPVAYSYRIKRVPMARVMKEYEPFLDWMQVVLSVQHPLTAKELEFPYDRFVEMAGVKSGKYYSDLTSLLSRGKDEAKRHQAYAESNQRSKLPFAGRGVYGSNSNFHRPSCELLYNWVTSPDAEDWVQAMYVIAMQAGESRYSTGGNYIRHLRIEHAQQYLRNLGIFLNRDDILEKVRLDDGAVPSKQNTKFFTEIRFAL